MRTATLFFCLLLAAGVIWGGVLAGTQHNAVDPADLEQSLKNTGLDGEIHGAVPALNLFSFTYRSPADFFSFIQLSLVAGDAGVAAQFAGFRRHDRVRVKGTFLPNPSGQRHVLVTSVEMLKAFAPPMEIPAYDRDVTLPKDLEKSASKRFLVHIANADTGVFVVEYRDAIVPVYVRNPALLKGLYRNDVVELSFRVQDHPSAPSHLNLNETDPQPLRVVDSIREKHGKPASMEGALVMFPQSPQIRFNVFAVDEQLPDGLKRQYTLTNFEDPAVFTKIREKLQAAWDKEGSSRRYENGRNKLISRTIRVRVTGVFNQIDPAQANPQILLSSPGDIQILVAESGSTQ